MVKVYGKNGVVYNDFKAINKAFKNGGVSVGVSCSEDFNRVSDVLFNMVKVDAGGFVFTDGDGGAVGELSDDAFAGRYKLKNKILSVISDSDWSDSDLLKFKKLCVSANRFGCMIIVHNLEKNRLGGVVDFTVGGSGNIVVEDISSNSNSRLFGNGSNRLPNRSGGSLLDRLRNG